VLRENFATRAHDWLARGLLEESVWLRTHVEPDRFHEFGFEYQLAEALRTGIIDTDTFLTTFVQKNWQYAKRQYTWLKRNTAIKWFRPDAIDSIKKEYQAFLSE
jgi:tRNA A37 N6-isopentenylltransferase MiaA